MNNPITPLAMDGDIRDGKDVDKINEIIVALNSLLKLEAVFSGALPTKGSLIINEERAVLNCS